MEKTIKSRVKLKKDTQSNWQTKNPVLLNGEIALVECTDGVRVKVGDGATKFSSLPYIDELTRSYVSDGYVPNTRKVNGKALSADVTLSASDVGAAASSHTHDDRYYTESEMNTKLSGKADSSHTHSAATTSANGFMSSTDKSKLDGIATGANKTTVDSALSSTSTNPVQNKVINSALSGKANSSHTHNYAGSSSAGGAATSANKLATARTIALTGFAVGSGNFDGSGNLSIRTKGKRCYVGQSGSTITKPWYKFASLTLNTNYVDSTITFKVNRGYADSSKLLGILTAHIRTNGQKTYDGAQFVWEYAGDEIDPSKFALVYKSTADTSTEVQLWCKIDVAYSHNHFIVISENSRTEFSDEWVLYNISSAGSNDTLPEGYTVLNSTLLNLKNNASTATKATQDGNGNNIVNTYCTKAELKTALEALNFGFASTEADM